MPIYTTTLPNGEPFQIMGPPDASDADIAQAASQLYAKGVVQEPEDTGERNYTFGQALDKAVTRGSKQLGSTFGDVIPAMVGSGLGFDEYAKRQMEEAQQTQEEIANQYRAQVQSYKDVNGPRSAAMYALETVGEQIPNIATTLIPGGIGGQIAKRGAAGLATAELAKKQAIGQGVGVYLGSYALNTPEIFQNIYQETGELETGTAVLFGSVAAALDSVLPASVLQKISPLQKAALAKALLKKSGTRPGLLERTYKSALKGITSEGLTEGAQEAISISAENFVANNPQLFDSADWDRIMESSIRGAVAGGVLGGVAGPFTGAPKEPSIGIEEPTPLPLDITGELSPSEISLTPSPLPLSPPPPTAAEMTEEERQSKIEAVRAENQKYQTELDPIEEANKRIAAGLPFTDINQLPDNITAEETIPSATTAEEAAAIESDLLYQQSKQEAPQNVSRSKNGNEPSGMETLGVSPEVPVQSNDKNAEGAGGVDGGGLGISSTNVRETGGRETVRDVPLTDQEKALKNEIARKYLPRINEAREKLRILEETELAKVSGNQAATYKLIAEQEARRKKTFMKINDEGMAEFEASKVKKETVRDVPLGPDTFINPKTPIAKAWGSFFPEVPYAKLGKEIKTLVTEAVQDGYFDYKLATTLYMRDRANKKSGEVKARIPKDIQESRVSDPKLLDIESRLAQAEFEVQSYLRQDNKVPPFVANRVRALRKEKTDYLNTQSIQESRADTEGVVPTFEGKEIPQSLIDAHIQKERARDRAENADAPQSKSAATRLVWKAEEAMEDFLGLTFEEYEAEVNKPRDQNRVGKLQRAINNILRGEPVGHDIFSPENFRNTVNYKIDRSLIDKARKDNFLLQSGRGSYLETKDVKPIKESRADTEGTGQTAETVTAELVQEFGPNVTNMQKRGKLVIVDTVDQLPDNIEMSSTANGAFNRKTGTTYIVANRVQKGQARRLLLHEIGEHYGLEGMLGKDYTPSLNRLKTLKNTDETVGKIWNEVTQLYPEFEVGSVPFLQEVMAKVGEQAPNNSVFRRIVGLVKEFLRKLGLYDVNKFTTADIQDMILYSLRTSLAETSSREQVSSTPAVQMSKEELKTIAGWKPERITKLIEELNNNNAASNYAKQGTYYVATMSPQQFLDLASQKLKGTEAESIASLDRQIAEYFEGNSEAVLKWVNQNKDLYNPYNVPNLTFESPERQNAKITGHEGRHRARALQRLGVTQMPVLMIGPRRARAPDNTDTRFPKRVAVPNMAGKTFVKQDARNDFKENTVIENMISIEPKNETAIRELIDFNVNPEVSQDILFSKQNPPGGHNPVQYSKMMEFAGKQYTNIPTGTKKTIEGILDKVLELPTTLRAAWMGMLGLQNMADLYGKYLSSIQPLISILEKRAALTSKLRSEVDVLGFLGTRVVQGVKGRKVAEYNPKTKKLEVSDTKTTDQVYTEGQLKRWQQIVYDLSRENIDPRDMSVENQAIPLVVAFNNQPKELRDLALGYTARFEAYGDQYFEALKNNIPDNADKAANIQRLNEQFKNRLKFYHPFRRKGAYRIEYIPKGETEQSIIRVETLREAEKEIQKIKARGDEFRANTYIPNTSRRAEYPPSEFMKQVIDKLETSKVPQETIDEIYEYYLDLFPSDSIRQLMRKRQGTRGEIQDVVGGFTDVGARMASQISNLTYIPQIDKITNQITEEANIAQKTIDNMDMDPRKKERLKSSVANAARELNGPDSKSFMHNPVAGRLSSFGSYISYVASIAGNVSSAVVNLSQLALIVFPMLAGKYGVGKATRIIGEAIKLYFSGGKDNNRGLTVFGANLSDISFGMKNGVLRSEENYKKGLIKKEDVLSQDLLDLYEVGVNNSVFNRGIGYELTELRKVNAEDFTGTKAKFDTIMGWLFQNSERFNREVTFLAGYLAEKDTGSSADKSLKSAIEFTRRTHGTALSEIGPRFFQMVLGKLHLLLNVSLMQCYL
jgi:hypothetical protein